MTEEIKLLRRAAIMLATRLEDEAGEREGRGELGPETIDRRSLAGGLRFGSALLSSPDPAMVPGVAAHLIGLMDAILARLKAGKSLTNLEVHVRARSRSTRCH